MSQQYSNHTRYIPLWHMITGLLVIALPAGAIVNLFHSTPETHYGNALLVVISFILLTVFWYARWFALRAQDRAIRAEENLRVHEPLVLSPNHLPGTPDGPIIGISEHGIGRPLAWARWTYSIKFGSHEDRRGTAR